MMYNSGTYLGGIVMVFGEKNRGRLEVVNYDYKGMRIWSIGYSLCTVYLPGEELNTIKLKNFGYCPATKEFYYNKENVC